MNGLSVKLIVYQSFFSFALFILFCAYFRLILFASIPYFTLLLFFL